MRFYIVIILLLSILGYGIYSIVTKWKQSPYSKADPLATFSEVGESPKTTGQASTSSSDPESPSVSIQNVPSENVTATYRFDHRIPPAELRDATSDLQYFSDPVSRVAFVSGSPAHVSDLLRYFKAIDVQPGACSVQTWAVYVDRSVQKGFDLVAAINSVTSAETSLSIGNGSFLLDVNAGDITSALSIIADGSSVEVLQRPHVRLEDGKTSVIESIQEVPVPQTTTAQGIAQTSIDYRKVGLQLSVTPTFLSNDQVKLDVIQSNGLIGQTVSIAGNEVPVIQSQKVETLATLTVGQTVVLGGVSTQRETLSRGLLRNTKEVSQGALYIVLSTSYDAPKAVPVSDFPLPQPVGDPVPFARPYDDASEWIDDGLLPRLPTRIGPRHK